MSVKVIQVVAPDGSPVIAPCAISGCQYDRLRAEVERLTRERDEARRVHKEAVNNWTRAIDEAEADRDLWKNAVIDAAVVHWTYTEADETDPRHMINALLVQMQREALDPAISTDAQALIDKGRAEGQAERDRLRAALDKLEYIEDDNGEVYCPWCEYIQKFGHATDCPRMKALGGDRA